MPYFNDYPDTKPLTKEEKTWCRKLENILKKTPKRFGICTIGDPCLSIFDREEMEARGIEQEEGNDEIHNLNLASIKSSEGIQGWCG
jgi:hypothetical protein